MPKSRPPYAPEFRQQMIELVGAGRTPEWRRFGAAPALLDPFPGAIGGNVGGVIDVNFPYATGEASAAIRMLAH